MFLVNFRDPTEIRIPLTCNHKSRCIQYKYYISVYIYMIIDAYIIYTCLLDSVVTQPFVALTCFDLWSICSKMVHHIAIPGGDQKENLFITSIPSFYVRCL